MGSSAIATIFYGIPIGDEDFDADLLEDNFCRAVGVNPDVYAAKHTTLETAGISIEYDGCFENGETGCYLAVSSSVQFTEWSESLEIDVSKLTVGSDWDQKLRDFCNKAGVEFTKPKFLLIASYG